METGPLFGSVIVQTVSKRRNEQMNCRENTGQIRTLTYKGRPERGAHLVKEAVRSGHVRRLNAARECVYQ